MIINQPVPKSPLFLRWTDEHTAHVRRTKELHIKKLFVETVRLMLKIVRKNRRFSGFIDRLVSGPAGCPRMSKSRKSGSSGGKRRRIAEAFYRSRFKEDFACNICYIILIPLTFRCELSHSGATYPYGTKAIIIG